MIAGLRCKVCGLRTLIDAEHADQAGIDYLGFNLHPASPRFLPLEQFNAMRPLLPERKLVAVAVEPTLSALTAMQAADFDCFQIHFRADLPVATVAAWSETVGRDRLWLAPKLPPGVDVLPDWLELADTFLLDTFHADKFGGTGKTGDWEKFRRHQQAHPQKRWILAGGLNPDNVVAAVAATGTKYLDLNSGVETSPGVKDPQKLARVVTALRSRLG